MLRSLSAISAYRHGDESVPVKDTPWLGYLVSAEERVVNLERIQSLQELADANPVLDYVERTLEVLDGLKLSFWVREILEEVLVWSETAKGGTLRQRLQWQKAGINLFVHNIGSAQLYDRFAHPEGMDQRAGTTTAASAPGPVPGRTSVIRTLIETHGLIGQYIRGEVPFQGNLPLVQLVHQGLLAPVELASLLMPLNQCIITAVSPQLWEEVRSEVEDLIGYLADGAGPGRLTLEDRLRRLRAGSIRRGENFDAGYRQVLQSVSTAAAAEARADGSAPSEPHSRDLEALLRPLEESTLWYVESALQDFTLEEVVKVLLLAVQEEPSGQTRGVNHISFERLMNAMYYDYRGVKKINVYKKRIIEKYLRELSFEDIVTGSIRRSNQHLAHRVERSGSLPDTVFFTFEFSAAAEKLIDFCVEAEKSPLYEKAVLLLFDLFELRRDAYDRFHNEEGYLADMNATADYKSIMLDYITGEHVIDIGPGGGVMLDLIERNLPDTKPVGIDISANVIEALQRKKQLENHRWEVLRGDALNLKDYVEPGSIGTVIFSSILHELYSYIEWNGSKFNRDTVGAALLSAFDVLAPGGRIIIRDGIMTEPAGLMRRIRFLAEEDGQWLRRYAKDFAGRPIRYELTSDGEAIMPVNDAMEFLYTYTWGEEAYVHEVQEQFGYFTPSEYEAFIRQTLGEEAQIIESRHFLQEGYTEALAGKIVFTDEQGSEVPLPDSTCLIVIEKKR
ncbi:class I SAM-dependent methyltransferase [Paenibacillus lutrae]|uniref:Class I SAM-dependent methyltransferase n=1 Tax=Paenibacillus lutrae TaxID=2078573 RepID=A0A7X3FMD4_9BACL|nr:class I SAM-dependent methyltransferase [Paenibacillus lutrae]MVP01922.1 class I SAM-dependent methyltransferase [Paenibacillus lutrae]